jgi:ABC-type uncharacterized transport system substrate-binding protein
MAASSHSWLARAIPAICSDRIFYEAGGIMSYGASVADGYRVAGTYVGRILKGEKVSDLPVQQSTKVELAINLKVAKAFGIIRSSGAVAGCK